MSNAPEYPKTLAIIRDCHASHNLIVVARTDTDEAIYRQMAGRKGWKVAVRKRKPKEPTCDNCAHMEIVKTRSGNHRHCELFTQWIPDNEQSPVCSSHNYYGAFMLRITPPTKKGGRDE